MKSTHDRGRAIFLAFSAAAFYAVNFPFSKLLLKDIAPTMLAALLYLGAGIGVGILSLFVRKDRRNYERLGKSDLPYVIGMIVLDIAAPIFLMIGVRRGTSASASLLGNFEIVATTVIALAVFKEAVSKRLWLAIVLITLASAILSFEGAESFQLSSGSLFVLLAAICWGFENNCTRKLSAKNTYEIVILKGLGSGLGALLIALLLREPFPDIWQIAASLMLGFVAYGLSIFLYIRAQNTLGVAKTSAYYAAAPFIGAILSFLILKESLTWLYLLALAVMIAGTLLVVSDTVRRQPS